MYYGTFQLATADAVTEPFDLISYGFNMFTAELSGSPILITNFTTSDIETVSLSDECSFDALEFSSALDSFSEYAEQDALDIEAYYDAVSNPATGSMSSHRTSTRLTVQNVQYYIYTMKMQCVTGQLSIGAANELEWTSNFLNYFRILPRNYTPGDDLEDFTSFWKSFGTHILQTTEVGGSIESVVVADKCSVEHSYDGRPSEFGECLNAYYQGDDTVDCDYDIETTQFLVSGGSSGTALILQDFGDKTPSDFSAWADSLDANNLNVVGGKVAAIWDVIDDAISMGNHSLNDGLSTTLSDDEWMAIATAMESAYDDYSDQLNAERNAFVDGECDDIDCGGSDNLDTADCVCDCESVGVCCGFDDDSGSSNGVQMDDTLLIGIAIAVILVLCCIGTVICTSKRREHTSEDKGTVEGSSKEGSVNTQLLDQKESTKADQQQIKIYGDDSNQSKSSKDPSSEKTLDDEASASRIQDQGQMNSHEIPAKEDATTDRAISDEENIGNSDSKMNDAVSPSSAEPSKVPDTDGVEDPKSSQIQTVAAESAQSVDSERDDVDIAEEAVGPKDSVNPVDEAVVTEAVSDGVDIENEHILKSEPVDKGPAERKVDDEAVNSGAVNVNDIENHCDLTIGRLTIEFDHNPLDDFSWKLSEDKRRCIVGRLLPDSKAKANGVAEGFMFSAINGENVENMDPLDIKERLEQLKDGQMPMTITFLKPQIEPKVKAQAFDDYANIEPEESGREQSAHDNDGSDDHNSADTVDDDDENESGNENTE